MIASANCQPDVGQAKPEQPAGDRQQQAFGQQVSRQPPAGGAERQPHGELALPRRRSRQHQVGEVRAGDEQHERDGAEQNHRRRPDVLQERRRPRRGREPPALILLERPALPPARRVPPRPRARRWPDHARPRRQPRKNRELTHVSRHSHRITAPRDPQIGADSNSPGGITPTIVLAIPPMRIGRFRIAGSPAKRLCQSR